MHYGKFRFIGISRDDIDIAFNSACPRSVIFKFLLLIDVKNRTIDPNDVWFMFIIGFNLYYHFKLVNSIATSLSNEFADRKIAIDQKRPGETVGYINSTFLVTYVIYFFTFSHPNLDKELIDYVLVYGALISWIIYWVKINKYKKLLIADNNYKRNNE